MEAGKWQQVEIWQGRTWGGQDISGGERDRRITMVEGAFVDRFLGMDNAQRCREEGKREIPARNLCTELTNRDIKDISVSVNKKSSG